MYVNTNKLPRRRAMGAAEMRRNCPRYTTTCISQVVRALPLFLFTPALRRSKVGGEGGYAVHPSVRHSSRAEQSRALTLFTRHACYEHPVCVSYYSPSAQHIGCWSAAYGVPLERSGSGSRSGEGLWAFEISLRRLAELALTRFTQVITPCTAV